MEEVRNWLRRLGLEQYACKFENEGWDTLEILKHMGPDDIESCIDKPGHRKKFELGLMNIPPTGETPKVTTASSETVKSCEKEMIPDRRESYKEYKKVDVAAIRENPSDIPTTTDEIDSYQEAFRSFESGETSVLTTKVVDDSTEHNTSSNNKLMSLCNAAKLTSDTDSELGEGNINEELAETVYVKGAKNKILKATAKRKLRKKLIGHNHDRSLQGLALPVGILAVEECIKKNLDTTEYMQPYDSSSTSEEENNTVDSSVAEVRSEHQLFARGPSRPIKKATIVKDSKNVTVAERAEIYHIKKKTTDNFKVPSPKDLKAAYRPGSLDNIRTDKPFTPNDVFVKVDFLQAKSVFGLNTLKYCMDAEDEVFDVNSDIESPILSLVSCGAEVIMLSKKVFLKYADQKCRTDVRDQIKVYPSESILQDNMQTEADWSLFKKTLLDRQLKEKKMKERLYSSGKS